MTADDRSRSRLARVGTALRWAFRSAVRPLTRPHIAPPMLPPSAGFAEAETRVRKAAQSLEIVAALSLNPVDPHSLDAGIDVALRRLVEDLKGD